MSLILHASWSGGMLHLWAEDAQRHAALVGDGGEASAASGGTPAHAFATRAWLTAPLRAALEARLGTLVLREATMAARLPALVRDHDAGVLPAPSTEVERVLGRFSGDESAPTQDQPDIDFEDPTAEIEEPREDRPQVRPAPSGGGAVKAAVELPVRVELRAFDMPTWGVPAEQAGDVLLALAELLGDDGAPEATQPRGLVADEPLVAASDLRFWTLCARLGRHVLAQQRFVPMLVQVISGDLRGAWRPWLSDDAMAAKATALVRAMPPVARAPIDAHEHDPWAMTEDFLGCVVDAWARRALANEGFADAIDGRDPGQDAHVAWLTGLLGPRSDIRGPVQMRQELVKRIRVWIGSLEERGASSAWRLMLRLSEPVIAPGLGLDAMPDPAQEAWTLSFHLQSVETPGLIVDASDIWLLKTDSAVIMGKRLEGPQELLLKELGRASRVYKRLEAALTENEPEAIKLSTRNAYEFLREVRPLLLEQGFGADAPVWWDSPLARVGAKLKLESDEQMDPRLAGGGLSVAGKPQLGLATLVNYTWEISVGDTTLTLDEFEQLASKRTPLVRVNGRWVEIRPEDVHAAIKFIRENPGGKIRLSEAMRLAYSMEVKQTGIPVVGMEATGWVQGFLNSEAATKQLELLPPPKEFRGTLRPYQARGVSWMMFQERLGFGLCLADDMGLGKTVQLLALLAYEREGEAAGVADAQDAGSAQAAGGLAHGISGSMTVQPTLLLVPMSVVGNWVHETKRFCPHLRVLVHHGAERTQGEKFLEAASNADLVITTYALAHRDREMLTGVKWGRVVLDEAQYIKNPTSKQAQAARALEATNRIALTGTPVENRLTELWSIMDFLNPGYLGSAAGFRTRYAVPIERYHDKHKGEQLRGLIRPFVLRRLKSDPTVVADLPAKVETKEYGHLTAEQASLYESCVNRMLAEVDAAEGIQRRGLVLSSLIKLKQICNHPAQAMKDWDETGLRAPDPSRSGKCARLLEMLDEVLAEGDQCLIFTQFRQMGRMLEIMIQQRFGKEVLFIHGGVTQQRRQQMIEQFQKADGSSPVLLLSLRAGGVGLNLTAATHVFHFDRWWNPAVENQATDRAYRIGQTRTVQVHKFVVKGTLEERIDQMIESKSELAENIIGQGEAWLSELSTDQLRDILTLRNDAIDDVE